MLESVQFGPERMAAGGVAVADGLVATHGAAHRVSLAHCLRIVRILQVLKNQRKRGGRRKRQAIIVMMFMSLALVRLDISSPFSRPSLCVTLCISAACVLSPLAMCEVVHKHCMSFVSLLAFLNLSLSAPVCNLSFFSPPLTLASDTSYSEAHLIHLHTVSEREMRVVGEVHVRVVLDKSRVPRL